MEPSRMGIFCRMERQNQHNIVGGPSKLDLMLSLFDSISVDGKKQRRPVTFKVDGVGEIEIIIDKVERMSEKTDAWKFEGHFVIRELKNFRPWISGWYYTDDRSGHYFYHAS